MEILRIPVYGTALSFKEGHDIRQLGTINRVFFVNNL